MNNNTAFALGLITSALQWIFVMLSWVLTTYLGRRTIYVWGTGINTAVLIAIGIAGSVYQTTTAQQATASLGLIVSVLFCLGPAPASWVIIGETSALRLRPLTTGTGRAAYYIMEIPCIFLASYMLNPTGGNRKLNSQYNGILLMHTSWRQMWLRLGRNFAHLFCHRLLPGSRNEEPFIQRNRHSVQASRSCS